MPMESISFCRSAWRNVAIILQMRFTTTIGIAGIAQNESARLEKRKPIVPDVGAGSLIIRFRWGPKNI